MPIIFGMEQYQEQWKNKGLFLDNWHALNLGLTKMNFPHWPNITVNPGFYDYAQTKEKVPPFNCFV